MRDGATSGPSLIRMLVPDVCSATYIVLMGQSLKERKRKGKPPLLSTTIFARGVASARRSALANEAKSMHEGAPSSVSSDKAAVESETAGGLESEAGA